MLSGGTPDVPESATPPALAAEVDEVRGERRATWRWNTLGASAVSPVWVTRAETPTYMDWPANGSTPVTLSLVSAETGWSRRTRPEVSVSQTWPETGVGFGSDVGTDPQARLISRPTASGMRVARYISIASPGGTTPTTWVSLMSGRLCTPGGRSRATSGAVVPGDTETVTATGTGAAEDGPPGDDATGAGAAGAVVPGDTETVTTTGTGAAEDGPPGDDATGTGTAGNVASGDTETVTATGTGAAEDGPPGDDATGTGAAGAGPSGDPEAAGDIAPGDTETVTATGTAGLIPCPIVDTQAVTGSPGAVAPGAGVVRRRRGSRASSRSDDRRTATRPRIPFRRDRSRGIRLLGMAIVEPGPRSLVRSPEESSPIGPGSRGPSHPPAGSPAIRRHLARQEAMLS
jgi:hypothetical protein